VDNCLGGFLLSFLAEAGHFSRPWDFDVEGVTRCVRAAER
jgi:glutamate/tyrosine decarboxylase-like PLP-dependent enzyme